MVLLPLTVYLLFSCFSCLTEARTLSPRMIFKDKETAMKRLPLPGHNAPTQIVLEGQPDTVTAAGHKHLISFNFQNPQKTPVERRVLWKECIDNGLSERDCNYNITVVHKREEANQVFVCGTDGKETLCCEMNLSEESPMCIPSEKMGNIKESIREFIIKEGEPSELVESAGSADLYITYSGSKEYVGIHKFGKNRVGPSNHDKEQHYVGLVLSRRRHNFLQDKVYAFYREKNTNTDLYSDLWLPFVTQICMADVGGPKNNLQFSWTSQMNARLFCGNPASGQHFSELVDVATEHADQWQNTRVYALFRNEWGMSAVCVYTIQDIDNLFTTSPFKGYSTGERVNRPRTCVSDSRIMPLDSLRMIEKTLEMEKWVQPENNLGPLLFNHHNYTHICVDGSPHKRNNHHPVLFLSPNNEGIHKVVQNKNLTFVIAEYQPLNDRTHILSIILHPSSRKLYVNSRSEMVQLDVANCAQYGDSCEDCVLARDPYCGWNGTHCTPTTSDTLQDVAQGNHSICVSKSQLPGKVLRYSTDAHADEAKDSIRLSPQSKYFLQCPVLSHHAQYTWDHHKNSTSCSSREQQCLLLIDSMGPEQVGTYTCVSEEMGHRRVLAQYQLQLENRAVGHSLSPLVRVCLMAVLIQSLSC